MASLYEQLKTKDGLTDVEGSIADYVIENSDSIRDMSIQTLASNTHTSPATITRFCKKLGISGFKSFKTAFVESLHVQLLSDKSMSENILSKDQSELDIIESIGNLEKNAIAATQLMLNPELIQSIVQEFIHAKSIYAIGVSDSFLRILDFQNKMFKINYYVKLSLLQPEQTFMSAQAQRGDIGLLVSYSGTTAEVVNAAKILKSKGVTLIALTAHKDSPVGKLANHVVMLPKLDEVDVMARGFYSRISIDFTLDVIYASLYRLDSERNQKHIIDTSNQYLNK